MPNIMTVDYNAMPGQASQMRSEGQAMNSDLITIYTQVTDMREKWYGVRYNALVDQFNGLIPSLREMLKIAITEIPFTLETIASNYARVDGTSVASPQQISQQEISEISHDSSIGMRFITGDVENIRNQVETKFKSVIDHMNNMQSVLNGVTWESEASEAFRSKFTTLKGQIDQSIEEINKSFVTLMNQTMDDMAATEQANTVQ